MALLLIKYLKKMSLQVKGNLKTIGEIKTFDSGFRKQEIIIETEEKYPQLIKFEILKDNIEKFEPVLIEGASLEVHFNLNGREFNGTVYNSLQAWKINLV